MSGWDDMRAERALRAVFAAAVAAADPAVVLAGQLPQPPSGRCIVLGAGKAAASMAAAVEAAWPEVVLSGLVVTAYGHGVPTRRIEVVEAAHPVPDAAGEAAARRILALAQAAGPEDLVLALVSGGGSALLALPAPGVTLDDKQAIGRALLASGATIGEINLVRRQLSAIKGGRLAMAAAPARVVTLVISDVPGDDPSVVASGPTVPPARAASAGEALAVLARYRIAVPERVAAWLGRERATGERPAARTGGEPGVAAEPGPVDVRVIADPARALRAAAQAARGLGLMPMILGDALEGESREVGRVMAGIARSVAERGEPLPGPALLLSGGETSVTMTADTQAARGGRNTEFLLAFALAAAGRADVWALAADTDGIDGNQDAAGAIVGPGTLGRAVAAGLAPRGMLDRHESFALFDALGDLVRTGPTRTNVNDFRAVLVGATGPEPGR